ncbi:flagellar hook-basal body complex protein FliE [Ramlibacter sp. H39-3-26]|uniref:flagellar hook-basal body complex protein FliE n=1 Tax=Curvibacter soli TaxID=3031331 RepID=UPI0023DA8FC0|nr:flagellar hook-basal body complex protein FliE [Ramlibacter sp. H39-3-26]MDF1484221.1 flagellar hook-basal body complex protein FliE [Ramlibacter sp. H39-3-26]
MDIENGMAASIRAAAAQIDSTAVALMPSAADDGLAGRAVNGGFLAAMQAAVRRVDGKEQAAADLVADVDSGRSDDMVGAMLASQEASLSFSMLMQARNKIVGAVDEVIKLQV